METVITVAAVLLGVVGLVLVGDVVSVWRGDRSAIGGPERAELVSGLAVLAFAGAFFVVRGTGEDGPAAPSVEPVAASSATNAAERAVSRLTSPARVPDLRAEPEPEPKPAAERPRREPEEAPPEPTTTTTTPTTTTPTTTTTTPATTPAPAPATPAPAPAPEPSPPASDVPFDSRE
jgi:hypothetical protein